MNKWWFPSVSASVSWWPCPVEKQTVSAPCCGLLQRPLPSEIDELIVWLLPVCLCPGRRCPGYGWESQLWHPPWGRHCSRPAGGPGGSWWLWEQLRLTYCCHTLGDTAAFFPPCPPTCPIDQLRQKWVHKRTRRLCQSFLNANSFGWGGRKKKSCKIMFFTPV